MKLDCKRVAHGQRGKEETERETDSQEQNVPRKREGGGGQKGGGGECGLPTADDMLITH